MNKSYIVLLKSNENRHNLHLFSGQLFKNKLTVLDKSRCVYFLIVTQILCIDSGTHSPATKKLRKRTSGISTVREHSISTLPKSKEERGQY